MDPNPSNVAITLRAIGWIAALLWSLPCLASGVEVEKSALLPAGTTYDGQLVRSFRAIASNPDGSFDAATGDDGEEGGNAAEIHIRVYKIRADFKTGSGGPGKIRVEGVFELCDPDNKIPFAIAESFGPNRRLTAADFAIESMQRAPDGTYWFGDSFGPFLIHTDKEGRLLDPPIELTDEKGIIRTADNPNLEEAASLRIMNAFRYDARSHGNKKILVAAPDAELLDDCNLNTAVDNRAKPPPGTGLTSASSEIFNVAALQQAGFEVIPYTVNDKPRMLELMRLKVNGIISDRPDLLREAVEEFDAGGDGTPGDLLDPDGLVDARKFSAQAHRGGRNLRPENTIPAMESALNCLVNTLETDCGITQDGIAVLSHDPFLSYEKWRRADNAPYSKEGQFLIKDYKLLDLRRWLIGDVLFRGPSQRNDRYLSPVSQAFFEREKGAVAEIYQIPSLDQLFRFVKFYTDYYRTGPGRGKPKATARWKNAARIRFNIETKLNPRSDYDFEKFADKLVPFRFRTVEPHSFAKNVAEVIVNNRMAERADIQSFDFRSLRYVHEHYPQIRTVFLFGDYPKFPGPSQEKSDDGTNLQRENGSNTPWLAELPWPYRETRTEPCRASGGFTGLALSKDARQILVMLGRPLLGGNEAAKIYEFDLETKKFTGKLYDYPVAKGVYADDFVMTEADGGFVLETDGSEGSEGVNAIYQIALRGPEVPVEKTLLVDLISFSNAGAAKALPNPFGKLGSLAQLDPEHLVLVDKARTRKPASLRAALPEDRQFFSLRIVPAVKP